MMVDSIRLVIRQPSLCRLGLAVLIAGSGYGWHAAAEQEFLAGELRGRIVMGSIQDRLRLLELPKDESGAGRKLAEWRASFPSWSPDGKRLVASRWAYPRDEPSGRFPIILEGEKVILPTRYLTIFDCETGSSQEFIRTDSLVFDFPSWSPDGAKIAFLEFEPAAFSPPQRSRGDKVIEWVFGLFGIETELDVQIMPTWGRLHVADVADGVAIEVTDIRSLPGRPSWSPDSKEIMFATVDSQIVAVDLSGTVTRELGNGVEPAWSPDGRTVAFYQRGGIYVKKEIDGTSSRLIVPPMRLWSFSYFGPTWPETKGGVTWSPDGQYLVYVGMSRSLRFQGVFTMYVVVRVTDLAMLPLYPGRTLARGCSWTR